MFRFFLLLGTSVMALPFNDVTALLGLRLYKLCEPVNLTDKLSISVLQQRARIDRSGTSEFLTNLPKGFLGPSYNSAQKSLFGPIYFFEKTMMFTAFNTECDSSSRCSTASPSTDNLGYFPSPAGSYSSMGSPQSQVSQLQTYLLFLSCVVFFIKLDLQLLQG